jgi:hypothetical protein
MAEEFAGCPEEPFLLKLASTMEEIALCGPAGKSRG